MESTTKLLQTFYPAGGLVLAAAQATFSGESRRRSTAVIFLRVFVCETLETTTDAV